MLYLSEGIWNLDLQPLKTSYLHYHNAYGHQTWQGGDLPRGTPASIIRNRCNGTFWAQKIALEKSMNFVEIHTTSRLFNNK